MTSPDPALADPMFRELRERHPDVDIVLLPPEAPLAELPPATPAQCRAIQAHADAVVQRIGTALEREPDRRAQRWWSQARPELRRWVVDVLFLAPDDEATVLLRTLADTLARLGWDPRPAADGSRRLRGAAGPCELLARVEPAGLAVTVRYDPMHVPSSLLGEGVEA